MNEFLNTEGEHGFIHRERRERRVCVRCSMEGHQSYQCRMPIMPPQPAPAQAVVVELQVLRALAGVAPAADGGEMREAA